MCGLTGFWGDGHRSTDLSAVARAMGDRIAHRGPDDSGIWIDESAGFALSHRRLAIMDLSPAGHQPMISAGGRYVVAYNGEIYNHRELRQQLELSGSVARWRGHSDTETLLACIESWGIEATLKRIVGMFAFALWDREMQSLVLARDRAGEKPLYYGWQQGVLLFGSELKALASHPAFGGEIDRGALSLLLKHNYVPAPYSIYKGINKLPPGSWLELRRGQSNLQPTAYWSFGDVATRSQAELFDGSEEDAIDELSRVLGRAVASQRISDVPIGALLSGGIDSTLITALMQSQCADPVRTFTIGFEDRTYDEADSARAIARHLGTHHTELQLTDRDALGLIPQLPQMYDEPFADSSQLPTHLVMKLARENVTVALSGDGGDELFGGYARYILAPSVWQKVGWMPDSLRKGLGVAMAAVPADTMNRLAGPLAGRMGVAQLGDKAHKLGGRLKYARNIDDFYVSLVSEWGRENDLVCGENVPSTLLNDRGRWPRIDNPSARMMVLDAMTYLPDDILVKVDRAAMAVSLETRAPFLDRSVMEFAWKLPMNMKLRDGKGKWILRRLLDRHVPRHLTDRPKMGFGIPLDEWLRGRLRDWAESLLAPGRLAAEGYIKPDTVWRTWQAHQRGEGNFGYRLWSVLMFQAWLEAQQRVG